MAESPTQKYAKKCLGEVQALKVNAKGATWRALHQCEGRLARCAGRVRRTMSAAEREKARQERTKGNKK